MPNHRLTFLPVLLLCLLPAASTAQPAFRCSANATCRSLLGYKPTNATTLSAVQTLFGVKTLRLLLGANDLPPSTPPTTAISPQQLLRVPIPCICVNGTGVSNKVPIYTVQQGDSLSVIATSVFMRLVTYQQIAAANSRIVPDPNEIEPGEKLWIPLPCSCEDVEGEKVVHYTHLVEAGNSVEGIASEFGTSNETLYRLNGIASDRQLIAGTPFDVPLRG
ncbi:unnamed protein product [Linum tenue]|uniref:LysM domain-containing protein n=1 Tax=Linum tenue TaxID=586396 RepID=A0AAV0JCU9_9ROSI|nr:unnamed protein product [Linum tenue]